MADQVFTLNVLDNKNYTLSSDGGFSARGQAGQMLKKEGVTLMVEAIHASPGSEFTVTKYSTLGMINQLAKQPDGNGERQRRWRFEPDLYR
ncbi:tyrosine kinase [Escherichia coli]|nr:tyrosine kinase [Escherichia coli]